MVASTTHLVLIPSYNSGRLAVETVKQARQYWDPVWVVIDGSTDESVGMLTEFARQDSGVRLFHLPVNQGKGAAIFHGLLAAQAGRFTHVLTMDADGQHPAHKIAEFMAASIGEPQALVLGVPVFSADAPSVRVKGRKVSNGFANLETLWEGVDDSLFGFRVYPVAPLLAIMQRTRWMRRFDFDVEAAVRLAWRGCPLINLAAPVRYFSPDEGGVSHFRYGRDNALLTWMHTRLMIGFLLRLPLLLLRRLLKTRS